MRKLICILIILSLYSFPITINQTSAGLYELSNNEYRRIITEQTPFYLDSEGKQFLFYLPYTYYVKILNTQGDYFHIECYGTGSTVALDGYVPKNMLYYDGLTVKNPYLEKVIKTANSTVLYQDINLTESIQYVFQDRELTYYGNAKSTDGNLLFCVCYNNKIGYVKETDVVPFTLENHPNELTFLNNNENQMPTPLEPKPSNNKNLTSLKTAIVACLLFAGITAIIVVSNKKTEKRVPTNYYDENDFE